MSDPRMRLPDVPPRLIAGNLPGGGRGAGGPVPPVDGDLVESQPVCDLLGSKEALLHM